MNWDDLRLFLAVARERSVSGAGKRLGMHHTNVARRMSRFEESLGTRLLDRSKAGYTLTEAGDRLYRQAVTMEEQAQAIERSLVGLDVSLRGTVKLTANQDFFDALIAHRLGDFYGRYPDICLEVVTTSRVLNLDAREADIALRVTPSPDEHLVGRRVSPLVMGLYASTAYQPNPGDAVRVMLFRRQSTPPDWVLEHFPNATVFTRVDSLRSARAVLRQGLGVACLPCFYADQDPALRRLDLPFESDEHGIWLLSHADVRTSARVRACRDWLVQVLNEQHDLLIGQRSQWADRPFAETPP